MEMWWVVFVGCWATLVAGFDLGPIVRIARCRSQCLRKHTTDGICDSRSTHQRTACGACWQYCEALENRWEKSRSICEGEQYLRCTACETACGYRRSRVEEKYLPSTLPAPRKAPIELERFDVAVVMRKDFEQWRVAGYYPGERTPTLRPNTWIIVAMEDGVKHYSWQEWVPKLERLKEGPLYEATISWKDERAQLEKQKSVEQVRSNNRARQSFLEKYGEKVLAEWRRQEDSPISDEVFRRFFFRRKEEQGDSDDSPSESDGWLSSNDAYSEESVDEDEIRENRSGKGGRKGKKGKKGEKGEKESYVVSWEPEAGGLIGNQLTDSDSAEIALMPGTKYLVRIASNEGPGSFPIQVDTRPDSVQASRIQTEPITEPRHSYPWHLFAALASASASALLLLLLVLALFKLRSLGKVKILQADQV